MRVIRHGKRVVFRTTEYLGRSLFAPPVRLRHSLIHEPFDYGQDKFMAKMLYFLPYKHQKMIRCYGIYAHGAGEKLQKITNATWKSPIEHSFDKDPEQCPDCGREMLPSVVYGYNAEKVW